MKKFLIALALLAGYGAEAQAQNATPAYWQGPRTPGNVACYQNTGSGTTLQDSTVGPCNMTTTNNAALNNGLTINSGYTGAIPNTGGLLQYMNQTLDGSETCAQQMFRIFDVVQGYFTMDGVCGTTPAGTTVHQWIPGLFSQDNFAAGTAALPLVAQGIGEVSSTAVYGLNTVHLDSALLGTSSASSISGTTATIGGTLTGSFNVGDYLFGTGVAPGTTIVSQTSGPTGGAGTYTVNNSQTVASTRISDHKAGLSGMVEQDELDFFANNNDTRARVLIDGNFPNGAATTNNIRSGVQVTIFSGSAGHWQNGFITGSGAADIALLAGTNSSAIPAVTGTISQDVGFMYTDNTNNFDRRIYLDADPTNAGATGADLLLTSSYSGAANLSIPTGVIKVGGATGVSCAAGTVNPATMVVTGGIITHC